MAAPTERPTAREELDAAIDQWIDEALAQLPPLTEQDTHAAVAIFATVIPHTDKRTA